MVVRGNPNREVLSGVLYSTVNRAQGFCYMAYLCKEPTILSRSLLSPSLGAFLLQYGVWA